MDLNTAARYDGADLGTVVSSRVTMIRQHEKYEHTRADADAAAAAGRWRLAVLSARASVGFAIDTVRAGKGLPVRDEVHRFASLADVVSSRAARAWGRRLLQQEVADANAAAQFVEQCWVYIDDVLQPARLGVPGYYYGVECDRHEALRREWLAIAPAAGAVVPYTEAELRQIAAEPRGLSSGEAPSAVEP